MSWKGDPEGTFLYMFDLLSVGLAQAWMPHFRSVLQNGPYCRLIYANYLFARNVSALQQPEKVQTLGSLAYNVMDVIVPRKFIIEDYSK